VPRVEAHAALLLDQLSDALGRPEIGPVPERFRAPLEGSLDPPQVGPLEAGLATRTAGVLQPGLAARGHLLRPAMDRLAVDAHPPCHLGL